MHEVVTVNRTTIIEWERRRQVADREGDTTRAGIYHVILADVAKGTPQAETGTKYLPGGVRVAAERLGLHKATLYRKPEEFPFMVNVGEGRWRVDETAFTQYVARHRSTAA
jgi:hypothetical protein